MTGGKALKTIIAIAAIFSVLFFLTQTDAKEDQAGINVKWGYKGNIGPERWGQLSPLFALCAKGHMQSPINIPEGTPTSAFALTLNYFPAPMAIVDDGDTSLTIGRAQLLYKDGHGVQLNFNNEAKEGLIWQQKKYRLIQFHFHSPSENEWHGRDYPLEIHFVHQGKEGEVVAIGVFVKAGKFHPGLQKIINNLPSDRGVQHLIANEKINPIDFIPAKLDYYHFLGSLTTPPCTEGFHWLVMAEAITATPAQIVEIRKAAGGANARPVQPTNNREISYSSAP